jgi:N-acetylmuramoyl-L-alanine amidase
VLFSLQKKSLSSDATKSGSSVTNSAITSDSALVPESGALEELSSLSGKTIVIDAGHGGPDPGKVGINQALEKDVNLSISMKIKELLESCQADVVMTRTEDACLGENNASGNKRIDMQKRIEIINSSDADLAVSIHQNSFEQESSKGAQVFYHVSSNEGQRLAEALQDSLITLADPENHRSAKANDSYYLLKKSTCPLVIVECGFLSNPDEAGKLCTGEYQNILSEAVAKGIACYLNNI